MAGYLHDVGNGINRLDHGIAAALFAQHVLERLGMPPEEYAEVMCAIGNHEEEYGEAVSSRRRRSSSATSRTCTAAACASSTPIPTTSTIASTWRPRARSLARRRRSTTIKLESEIDTTIIQVMQYFEIFLERMVMCRRAAEFLGCSFGLVINGSRLL